MGLSQALDVVFCEMKHCKTIEMKSICSKLKENCLLGDLLFYK